MAALTRAEEAQVLPPGDLAEAVSTIRLIRQSAPSVIFGEGAAFQEAIGRIFAESDGMPVEVPKELMEEIEAFISNALLAVKVLMIGKVIEERIIRMSIDRH